MKTDFNQSVHDIKVCQTPNSGYFNSSRRIGDTYLRDLKLDMCE